MRRRVAILLILGTLGALLVLWRDERFASRAGAPRQEAAAAEPAPMPEPEPAPDPAPGPPAPLLAQEIRRVALPGHDWVFRLLEFDLRPDRGAPAGAPVLERGWIVIDTRSHMVQLWFPGRRFDAESTTVESVLRRWVGPGAARRPEVRRGPETGLNLIPRAGQASGRWTHLESPVLGAAGRGWEREATLTLRFRIGGVPYTLQAGVRYPAEDGRPVLIVRDGSG